jgi:hypothetical protein
MSFHGYALFKGFDRTKIYMEEIWRVALTVDGRDAVRYANHYCATHPVSTFRDLIQKHGFENFRLNWQPLSPDAQMLPIVMHWEKNFGMYPEAYGI